MSAPKVGRTLLRFRTIRGEHLSVAKSILPPGVSDAEIQQQTLQLMTANPGVTTMRAGDVLNLGDGTISSEAEQTYSAMNQTYEESQLQPIAVSLGPISAPSQVSLAVGASGSGYGSMAFGGVPDPWVIAGMPNPIAGLESLANGLQSGVNDILNSSVVQDAIGGVKSDVNMLVAGTAGLLTRAFTQPEDPMLAATDPQAYEDAQLTSQRLTGQVVSTLSWDPSNPEQLRGYEAATKAQIIASLVLGGYGLADAGFSAFTSSYALRSPLVFGEDVPSAFGQSGAVSLRVQNPFAALPSEIQQVAGRNPINSIYAGQKYPLENLPPELQATYPNSVQFSVQGFPDFSPYAVAEVELNGLNGNYANDAALANAAAGLDSTPAGYVWHHVEDGMTMQLIPQDLHNAVRHTGGAAVIRAGE